MLVGDLSLILFIVSVRLFCFLAILAPLLYKELHPQGPSNMTRWGVVFGLGYVIFHTLGTTDTYEMLKIGSLSITGFWIPAYYPPFYGREVSNFSIMLGTVVLIFCPALRVIKSKETVAGLKSYAWGILIFAMALLLAMPLGQWWVIYATSILCAIFWMKGIMEMTAHKHREQEWIKFALKTQILEAIQSYSGMVDSLPALLRPLGFEGLPLIVVVTDQLPKTQPDQLVPEATPLGQPFSREALEEFSISQRIQVLWISQQRTTVGLVFHSSKELTFQWCELLLLKFQNVLTIGVGEAVEDWSELTKCLKGANKACEHGLLLGGDVVVSASDVAENEVGAYPQKELDRFLGLCAEKQFTLASLQRDHLLQSVSLSCGGDVLVGAQAFQELLTLVHSTLGFQGESAEKWRRERVELAQKMLAESDVHQCQKLVVEHFNVLFEEFNQAPQQKNSQRVDAALKFIDDHLHQPIGLEDVAVAAEVSTSYLKKILKMETGQSVTQIISEKRLQLAVKKLLAPNASITEIAYAVGFNDSNYFSTVFKKHFGLSPSEYREQHSVEGLI